MRRACFLFGFLLLAAVNASERMKMAILEPIARPTSTERKEAINIGEVAERVIPRFIDEAHKKFRPRWDSVEFVPYERAVEVQREIILKNSLSNTELIPRPLLRVIAQRLQCRYIVQVIVSELSGRRKDRASLRPEGRAVIDIYVFDAELGKYVWHEARNQTSGRVDLFGGTTIHKARDQAFLNALREGLQPFVLHGERKEVRLEVDNLVATVRSVASETGIVLLDVGVRAKVHVGMGFVSLDGKCRLRVKEVLANGSIAEVLEGTPEVGQVFKSVD